MANTAKIKPDEQILHFTEVGDILYISYISNKTVRLEKITLDSNAKLLFTKVADEIASSNTNLDHLSRYLTFLALKMSSMFKQIRS